MNTVRASAVAGRTRTSDTLRRCLLAAVIGAALATSCASLAAAAATGANTPAVDAAVDATFDRSMLSGAGQNTTDLSRFERGDFVPAGSYRVDVYLDERPVGRSDVRFAAPSAEASATPCVTPDLLDLLSLHPAQIAPETEAELANPSACVDFARVIPGASMNFNLGDLRLDANVPQAYLGQRARGYVDPKYWDQGVTAGLLNYNFNSYRTSGRGLSQTSAYLGLDAGLNVGRWRLRHESSLVWQSATGAAPARRQWQNIATYAQRDFTDLRAQLTVGDSWTRGDIFDSVGLRGVQLATDDRMLPQSLRGYAPTVRGVADGNAKVTVRQNGMVIYQTTVSPGPFEISDLYATGYGGDLEVMVNEASGRVHTFSVPYASVPQLLRPGLNRFSVAAGQLRDNVIDSHPGLLQATWQHGFSNRLSGYAGVSGTTGYAAALLGSALNTRLGALALDVTAARTRIPGLDTLSGQSVRLSYSKTVEPTGTTLSVAAYRYSTSGFLGLRDAARARDYARRRLPVFAAGSASLPPTIDGVPISDLLTPAQQAALLGGDTRDYIVQSGVDRRRNDFSLTLSQSLGEHGGSLYASGSARDYWNRGGTDTQYQVGYNNALGRVSYSISASRERDLFGRSDNRFMLSLTVPLGNDTHSPTLTGSLARDTSGGAQQQATLSGVAGADDQLTYGATASHDSTASGGNVGSTVSLNGGYRGPHVQVNTGFGHGSGYSQASLGVSGGLIAHAGGVTLSQPLGDTVAIVRVPDAAGARVGNASGLRVDRHGYAVIPYLTPYQLDTVTLDPTGLPLDVQLETTSAQIAPRAGSVVLVKFKSESGRFVLIQTKLARGGTLPFGADVMDEHGTPVGVVGQAGRIMVRVPNEQGTLTVSLDDKDGSRACVLPYHLPNEKAAETSRAGIKQLEIVCQLTSSTARPQEGGG